MGRCMLDVMARGGFEEKDIASIGVGIPGVADEKTGHVIFCTNLGWSDVPLRTELQKYLNKPVYIDNDATVAGFAESICGVSAGCHSSVFMTLGTGVGGGIVIGGRPWSGFHGVGSGSGHYPHGHIGGELPAPAATTAAWSATAAPRRSSAWASRWCCSTPTASCTTCAAAT